MPAAAAADPETLRPLFEQGVRLLQDGRMDEAKAVYVKVLLEDAANPDAHVNLAAIALEQQDMTAAVDHCAEVLTRQPMHGLAREVLAETNMRLAEICNNPQEYLRVAQSMADAIELAPHDSALRGRVAAVCRRFAEDLDGSGRADAAKVFSEKAEALTRLQ